MRSCLDCPAPVSRKYQRRCDDCAAIWRRAQYWESARRSRLADEQTESEADVEALFAKIEKPRTGGNMKALLAGIVTGLLAATVTLQGQTSATPSSTFAWTITSPAAPNGMTQAECQSQRYIIFGDANAIKIRANINDATAVGVTAAGVVCSATSPFAVTTTTTAGQVVGTALGAHTATITAERLLAGGSYADRVYGVPNCDFTFPDTRPSVPPSNFRIALGAVLELVGFTLPLA